MVIALTSYRCLTCAHQFFSFGFWDFLLAIDPLFHSWDFFIVLNALRGFNYLVYGYLTKGKTESNFLIYFPKPPRGLVYAMDLPQGFEFPNSYHLLRTHHQCNCPGTTVFFFLNEVFRLESYTPGGGAQTQEWLTHSPWFWREEEQWTQRVQRAPHLCVSSPRPLAVNFHPCHQNCLKWLKKTIEVIQTNFI